MTTTTFPRVCGCGETQDVTTVVMTDRLWTELFATPTAERPEYVAVCRVCIPDWHRYAGPLKSICGPRCRSGSPDFGSGHYYCAPR